MAELIPEITFTRFRALRAEQLRRLQSVEVTYDGEYLFTFVNGNTEDSGYLRTQTEYNCQTANAVGGKTLDEVLADAAV